jgi:hypothetical protein
MKLFVKLRTYNKYNSPDTLLIESGYFEKNRIICLETDLFKKVGKYNLMLDCREINLEEGILNIKYLKARYKN